MVQLVQFMMVLQSKPNITDVVSSSTLSLTSPEFAAQTPNAMSC